MEFLSTVDRRLSPKRSDALNRRLYVVTWAVGSEW